MSILDEDKIDIISINNDVANLYICDHLEWTGDEQEDNKHALLLQSKIETYINAYETGHLFKVQPETKDKRIVFIIIAKYCLNENGVWFVSQARKWLQSSKFSEIKLNFEWSDYREDD